MYANRSATANTTRRLPALHWPAHPRVPVELRGHPASERHRRSETTMNGAAGGSAGRGAGREQGGRCDQHHRSSLDEPAVRETRTEREQREPRAIPAQPAEFPATGNAARPEHRPAGRGGQEQDGREVGAEREPAAQDHVRRGGRRRRPPARAAPGTRHHSDQWARPSREDGPSRSTGGQSAVASPSGARRAVQITPRARPRKRWGARRRRRRGRRSGAPARFGGRRHEEDGTRYAAVGCPAPAAKRMKRRR